MFTTVIGLNEYLTISSTVGRVISFAAGHSTQAGQTIVVLEIARYFHEATTSSALHSPSLFSE